MNPYNIFGKPQRNITRSIKQLIQKPRQLPKEYVQSSNFSRCILPSGTQEHLITLEIPSEFPKQWLEQGYTHIHFGAVRIALTYHAGKGLPVFARIAVLDSRFFKYRFACLGMVETSLNAGTVFVTLFPNFNMALEDPTLPLVLKVQVQIAGAQMVENAREATLHYQMCYRIHDHAMDLAIPKEPETPLLKFNSHEGVTTCLHMPKKISRPELLKLMPTSWVNNYKKHMGIQKTVKSTDPRLIKNKDGSVTIKFDHDETEAPSPPLFSTQFMMQPCPPDPNIKLDILSFPSMPSQTKMDTVHETSTAHAELVLSTSTSLTTKTTSSSRRDMKQVTLKPTDRDAQGRQLVNSPPEAVLNWQSENAIAQNKALQRIEKNVTQLFAHFNNNLSSIQKSISDIQTRINNLYNQINSSLLTYPVNTQIIAEKEIEIRSLNTQLAELKKLKTNHTGFPTTNTYPEKPSFAPTDLPPTQQQSFPTSFQPRPPFQPTEPQPLPFTQPYSPTNFQKPQPMFPMPPQDTAPTQINDSSERWIMKLREERLHRLQKEREKAKRPIYEQPPSPHSPKPQPGITINPTHTK
ncbi:hypothetical protein CCACVL1_08766 [Corchorus capsularis]|uniref:Viral movement protein n=1 Tax=Corchorus capsularis TaxID=210143 RepID=A0A1R3IYZ2_COCAP|nr:hypothetical protein CCACVL1_08766 [Corchorus capsularis]